MGQAAHTIERTGGVMNARRVGFVLCLLAVIGIILSLGQPALAHADAEQAQIAISASDADTDCGDTGGAHGVVSHCGLMASCQIPVPIEDGLTTPDVISERDFRIASQNIPLGRTPTPNLQPPQNSIQA